jgi:putative ABC transport system ATP-binding protein
MNPLIKTLGIARTYGTKATEVRALKGVNLTIESGEFVAIMGPSGSGKSTLMNILGLLDRSTEGRYLFLGEDVSTFSHDRLAVYRNQHIGFVFQGFNLLPRFSAIENVAIPLIYRGVRPMERRERAGALLDAIGLRDRLHHQPPQLSGGEQQRVAIARAMVGNPSLVLADEPTGALDTEKGEQILALFQRLNNLGKTIILITHDPSVARHAKRIISLRDGQLIDDQLHDGARQLTRGSQEMVTS